MTLEIYERDALWRHPGNRPADDEIEFLSPEENQKLVDEIMSKPRKKGGDSSPLDQYEDTGITTVLWGRELRVLRNRPGNEQRKNR